MPTHTRHSHPEQALSLFYRARQCPIRALRLAERLVLISSAARGNLTDWGTADARTRTRAVCANDPGLVSEKHALTGLPSNDWFRRNCVRLIGATSRVQEGVAALRTCREYRINQVRGGGTGRAAGADWTEIRERRRKLPIACGICNTSRI